MNATTVVVFGVCVTLSAAMAYGMWRFDRRADRMVVVDAERIVEAEARRASRENHPSNRGRA